MSATKYWTESFETRGVKVSPITKELKRKLFIFGYNDPYAAQLDPNLLNNQTQEKFPKKGDSFDPNNDPLLKVQDIDVNVITTNLIEAIVFYSYPRVRLGQNTFSDPVAHFELGTTTQHIMRDLNGLVIGDVNDPDGEMGVDILIPTVLLKLQMPRPWPAKPAVWLPILTKCNLYSWFGCPPGYAQYMGSEVSWTGPGPDDNDVVHVFEVGYTNITTTDDQGNNPVTIDVDRSNAVWFSFKREQVVDQVTGSQFVKRTPTAANVVPVYKLVDFTPLLDNS